MKRPDDCKEILDHSGDENLAEEGFAGEFADFGSSSSNSGAMF